MSEKRPWRACHRLRFAAILMFVLIFSADVFGRTFDFSNESIATYFRGSYGPSSVGDNAFINSSGNNVTIDQKVSTNLGGELGVLFAGKAFNIRLGAEILLPKKISGVKGKDAAGAELFSLTSEIMGLAPIASIEILTYQSATSRLILGAGLGIAFVTLDNTYEVTPSGFSALGVGNFTESGSTRTSVAQAYVAYEILFTDTVTAIFDGGYRHLPVQSLKSTADTTAFTGSQVKGEDLVNMDGSPRSFDLSGAFVGLGFRFYIGL